MFVPKIGYDKQTSPGCGEARESVGELQLVAQDVVAMDRVDRGLVLPALAGQLAADGGAFLGDRAGEFLGQIKIAPDAFIVGTSETEHRLGVLEVDDVFELTVLGNTFWVVVPHLHDQRLQLLEFVRKTGRGFHPLAFLIAVFRS